MNDGTLNGLPSTVVLAGTTYRIVEEFGDSLVLQRASGEQFILRRFSNDLLETGMRVLVYFAGRQPVVTGQGYVRVLILGNVIEDLTGVPAVEQH